MKANFEKGTKICSKCRVEQHISNFSKSPQTSDKLCFWCKLCTSKVSHLRFVDNSKKILEQNRQSYQQHKKERLDKNQQWQQSHPVETRLMSRKSTLLSKYNLPLETFTVNLELQQNKCAICAVSLDLLSSTKNRIPHQDHSHQTGALRGILCHNCNVGLGKFQDSWIVIQYAIYYLNQDFVKLNQQIEQIPYVQIPYSDKLRWGRDYRCRRLYSLHSHAYEWLRTQQAHQCAICKEKQDTDFSFRIDHIHKTKVIRGLLCDTCNTGLGSFGDSISVMQQAVAYLQKFDER